MQVRYALLVCLGLYLVGQLFRLYFLLAAPVVGAGGDDLAAELGRLLRHRDGDGHLQRARTTPACGCRAVLRFLGDHPVVSWAIAGAVGSELRHVLAARHARRQYGAEYWFRWFLFGVFAFFLLAPAMFGDQTQGAGRRVPRQPAAGAPRHGVARLLPVPPRGDDEHPGVARARRARAACSTAACPTVFSLTFVRVDRGRVRELLPGREAVPATQGPPVVVVVAAPRR